MKSFLSHGSYEVQSKWEVDMKLFFDGDRRSQSRMQSRSPGHLTIPKRARYFPSIQCVDTHVCSIKNESKVYKSGLCFSLFSHMPLVLQYVKIPRCSVINIECSMLYFILSATAS